MVEVIISFFAYSLLFIFFSKVLKLNLPVFKGIFISFVTVSIFYLLFFIVKSVSISIIFALFFAFFITKAVCNICPAKIFISHIFSAVFTALVVLSLKLLEV